MIRSNVGNIVTNAMQVGSVAGTTYAGLRAHWNKEDQSTTLNNKGKQQQKTIEPNASQKEEEILNSASAGKVLTEKKTEKTPKEEFEEAESSMIPSVDSPQWDNVDTYVSNNVTDNKKRMSKYSVKPSEETPWYKPRKEEKK